MLDDVAVLSFKERKNIFAIVAFNLGITEQIIVEKDFWVSWILEKLFAKDNNLPAMIFKGGTSLSKAIHPQYENLIARFSEDVDITINKACLGYGESDEDITSLGSKRYKKYLKSLEDSTVEVISSKIVQHLEDKASILTEKWLFDPDEDNKESIIFHYPSCYQQCENQYLLPRIIVEFGSKGDVVPTDDLEISTYVQKSLPNLGIKSPIVTVLKPERTFWEKIVILHKIANSDDEVPIKDRMSRHYYDVLMLARKGVMDSAQEYSGLLDDVVMHNMAFFKSKKASYETATPGSFKLLPITRLSSLSNDYQKMQSMFFSEPPSFGELVSEIERIEQELNNR